MSSSEIYLVRHGDYHGQGLSPLGKEQAAMAADTLQRLLKGRGDVTLISSDRQRAVETADIIANKLNLDTVTSRRIGDAGNEPLVMRGEFNDFLGRCLDEAGVNHDPVNPLVVVTHAPMVAAAMGVSWRQIANGQVELYDGSTWDIRH